MTADPDEIEHRVNEHMAREVQALVDRLLLTLRESADGCHDFQGAVRLIEDAFGEAR